MMLTGPTRGNSSKFTVRFGTLAPHAQKAPLRAGVLDCNPNGHHGRPNWMNYQMTSTLKDGR